MAEGNRPFLPPQRVHRHVVDRVAAYLTVPQQACARRASKALWEAVRAESMEDLLRATVLEHRDTSNADAQLVFVAMSGGLYPISVIRCAGGMVWRADAAVRRAATAFPTRCCDRGLCTAGRDSPLPICEWAHCDDDVHFVCSFVHSSCTLRRVCRAGGPQPKRRRACSLTRWRRVPHSVPRRRDARAVPTHAGWRPAVVPPTDPLHCVVGISTMSVTAICLPR